MKFCFVNHEVCGNLLRHLRNEYTKNWDFSTLDLFYCWHCRGLNFPVDFVHAEQRA